MSFSRVKPNHVACVLVSSDFQKSPTKMWEIEIIPESVSFMNILGSFQYRFFPLKQKKSCPCMKNCDFTKLLELSKFQKILMDANLIEI